MEGLGLCTELRCGGRLLVGWNSELKRNLVKCGRCGHPYVEHELSKEIAAQQAEPVVTSNVVIPPHDYVASIPDRLTRLEKQVAQIAAEIQGLKGTLHELQPVGVAEDPLGPPFRKKR